jgi:hypothetical protein
MKLDASTGAATWVTRFGGFNLDVAQAVALDGSGNVYVSGIFRTRIANPTATFGSFTPTVQGNTTGYTSDLFAAALNSSGTFLWVSTGGISGSNDNIVGSSICYVPSLTEVVVTGNMRTALGGSTTATYSTTTPASSVVLTHSSSAAVNEDFVLLEVAAATGAFVSGSAVGAEMEMKRDLELLTIPIQPMYSLQDTLAVHPRLSPAMPPISMHRLHMIISCMEDIILQLMHTLG